MKLTLTILSVIVLVAAQGYNVDSSSTPSPSTRDPAGVNSTVSLTSAALTPVPTSLIPSSISPTCSSFLSTLNSASDLQQCITPVLNAFTSSNTPSVSSLCSTTASSCPDATFRRWLADFARNCTDELVTNPNTIVLNTYSVLYIAKPFSNAVCAQDGAGNYCLTKLASNSSAKAASGMANAAQTPLTTSDGIPDASAFESINILWIGANGKMNAADLCTNCTMNVLTKYAQWESSVPSVVSLASMPFLSSQTALWNAVQKTCPSGFMSGTLKNIGASPSEANGALTSSPVKGAIAMLAIVAVSAMAL